MKLFNVLNCIINNIIPKITQMKYLRLPSGDQNSIKMLRLSTRDELNNLPMPTVEVEVYHVWWEFDTDTFPPFS